MAFALGALALFVAGCAPVAYEGYYPPPSYSASVTYYDGYPGPRHYHGWHDNHHRYWR
jgi:hypothetical protein